MYFEARMHTTRAVPDALTAAQLINDGEARTFDALIWNASGRRLAVVADNHCDDPWLEVAVVDIDRRCQIDSITAGWCKGAEQLATYFAACETTDSIFRPNIALPLDGKNDNTPAYFSCGCCGSSFKSTYAEQRQYDQDDGFGICHACAN